MGWAVGVSAAVPVGGLVGVVVGGAVGVMVGGRVDVVVGAAVSRLAGVALGVALAAALAADAGVAGTLVAGGLVGVMADSNERQPANSPAAAASLMISRRERRFD